MKKTIYSLLAITALLFSSCESFTELEPKGKNLLTTTDQLEMLLNKEYEGCSSDMRQMAGDMIYAYSNVATIISQPVKTRNVIIWTYDEANMDKMAELTSSDQDYTNFYGYIGTIANPILSKVGRIWYRSRQETFEKRSPDIESLVILYVGQQVCQGLQSSYSCYRSRNYPDDRG